MAYGICSLRTDLTDLGGDLRAMLQPHVDVRFSLGSWASVGGYKWRGILLLSTLPGFIAQPDDLEG